ncbi:flavodoxin domain-containing protein [Filibacter tadaridae]|uniref:Flavodoxin n=1 Tax=Filibacter tadaridae TaxID=2483811 RepID=A0A3P5X0Y0_9BACL|nr:flavodoxin domain-containing protein [Filibacter tadaridae]VDC29025.1 Flavodoxin [Filibacter tadaridae]
MRNILIAYTSMTGNTEELAEIAKVVLTGRGFDVTVKTFDAEAIAAKEFLAYDGILFGTYTYDDGNLPYEIEETYDDLDTVSFTDKVVGVFGSGDSCYYEFCHATDLMAEKFTEVGAHVVDSIVKVDLDAQQADVDRMQAMVNMFCDAIDQRLEDSCA